MDLKLAGKTALVTASSGGIGLAIAQALAAERARVYINGRSQKSVDGAIATIKSEVPGADLLPLVSDNGTAAGCEETIRLVPEVDILVNNLGIYEAVGFFDESDADWQRIFEINIMSGVRLARHYLAKMLEKNTGRVIFISSESGVTPAPEMAHYSATKTMQLTISRSLAELTRNTAVTVNSVLPGPTQTDSVEALVKSVYPDMPLEEALPHFIQQNRPASLIGRFIDPKEIGDVVAFVCSGRAAAINGAAIRAEGGLVPTVF